MYVIPKALEILLYHVRAFSVIAGDLLWTVSKLFGKLLSVRTRRNFHPQRGTKVHSMMPPSCCLACLFFCGGGGGGVWLSMHTERASTCCEVHGSKRLSHSSSKQAANLLRKHAVCMCVCE